jgi:hypothetical protein
VKGNDVGLCGNAGVHDPQGARRGVQAFQHRFQGADFGDVAGKGLRPLHEAAAVQYQTQSHERTIAALFFRAPVTGFAVMRHLAFKIGMGQVVQRDRGGQPEQIADARE